MADTIIQALRDYFLDCPLMTDNVVNVDYLPEDTKKNGIEFSIDVTPAEEVIQPYIDGGARCQCVFTVRSVTDYGASVLQNLANSGLYERLSRWLQQQTRKRDLPALPEGLQSLAIEAQSAGYLFSAYEDAAKYQIQCRLIYYRKGAM